jgi:hypothetical protein
VLRKNVTSVARALFWARKLLVWSKHAPGALHDTLKTISTLLDLPAKRPEQVAQTLSDFGRGEEGEDAAPPAAEPADVAGVRGVLAAMSARLKEEEAPEAERRRAAAQPDAASSAAAWDYWRDRLQGRDPTGDVKTVICALAGAGPFALLRASIESMTLREWSLAFCAAIDREPAESAQRPPAWLAIAALRALGWGARPVVTYEDFRQLYAAPEGAGESDDEAFATPTERQTEAIHGAFITSGPGAVSEGWRPSPNHAALVLRGEEWSRLKRIWSARSADNPGMLGKAFGYDWVVVDLSGSDGTETTQRTSRSLKRAATGTGIDAGFAEFAKLIGSNRVAEIVREGQADPRAPRRQIVTPPSLEELFAALLTANGPSGRFPSS